MGWEKQVFEGGGGEWEASRSKITPAKFYNIANIASIQIQIDALKKLKSACSIRQGVPKSGGRKQVLFMRNYFSFVLDIYRLKP